VRIAATHMHEVGMDWGLAAFAKAKETETPQQREFARFMSNLLRARFNERGQARKAGGAEVQLATEEEGEQSDPHWAPGRPHDVVHIGQANNSGSSRRARAMKLGPMPRAVYGMFRALAVSMSLDMRQVVYRAVDALQRFVERFQPASMASGVSSAVAAALGGAMDSSSHPQDQPTSRAKTPAFVIHLGLEREQGNESNAKFVQQGNVHVVKFGAGRAKAAFQVSEVYVAKSDAVIEADVDFVLTPSFQHLDEMMLGVIDLMVLSGQRMRKIDAVSRMKHDDTQARGAHSRGVCRNSPMVKATEHTCWIPPCWTQTAVFRPSRRWMSACCLLGGESEISCAARAVGPTRCSSASTSFASFSPSMRSVACETSWPATTACVTLTKRSRG